MTREEAIVILNHNVSACLHGTEWGEALEMAITALEQEPCGDVISREAVHDEIEEWWLSGDSDGRDLVKRLHGRIDNIPSANPQEPKDGHWINIINKDLHDYRTGNKLCFECSECRSQYTYKFNYCPNCGCRMFEPQESEDKE